MTRTILATGLVALLFGSGCQSREEGLVVVCRAAFTCIECTSGDRSVRMASLAQHIASNVSNRDVKEFFAATPVNLDLSERNAALDAMLAEEGITDCPMRDFWASSSQGE